MIIRTAVKPSCLARRSARRGGIVTILIATLVVLVVAGVSVYALRASEDAAGSASTLELHEVSVTSFDITVTSSGELEAKNQMEIRSKLDSPAAIVEVAPEGTFARKGDLLVKLATDNLQTELEEEQLRVESARSELVAAENAYEIQVNENEAALRQGRLKLELAQIELQKWLEGDVVKRREELDLDIRLAKRRVDRLYEKHERTQELYDQGFASSDELKSDAEALVQAEADVKTAELNKWVFETFEYDKEYKRLNSDVEEAAAELERVGRQNESELASKDADRTNKRRQLAIREDRLADTEEQLRNATVTAPTGGLVVYATSLSSGRGWSTFGGSGPIQVGRDIRPNELIMVLPDTEQMVAAVRVHESIAGRIRPGQPATVRIEALQNRTFKGKVASIGVLAESEGWRDPNLREYTVKIDLEASASDESGLKPSMRCEAEILLGTVEETLATPVQAVFRDGPVAFVYTPRGARYERVPVAVGRLSNTHAEILGGLDAGQRVLLREPQPGEVLDTKFDEQFVAELREKSIKARRAQMSGVAMRPAGAPAQGGITLAATSERPAKVKEVKDSDSGEVGADDKPEADASKADKGEADRSQSQTPSGAANE